jgi:hypothetical protein
MPYKGKKALAKYLNCISPTMTQDYNFAKLQSFIENDFASKFGISAKYIFRYIMDF